MIKDHASRIHHPQFRTVMSRESIDVLSDEPGSPVENEESDEFDIGMNDINIDSNELKPVLEHASLMVTRRASEKSTNSNSTKYTNEGRKYGISVDNNVMGVQMTEL